MSQSCIMIEDLTMAYHEKPVLWDIDAKVENNSITAIVGPNGAGKSTLLKGILGLLKPLSGKVEVFGKPVQEVLNKIAYVPQTGSVNWDFPTTVLDVVKMGRYVHLGWIKRPGKKEHNLAMAALEKMGMADFANRQISQLSGGQRQRVFLARAICQDATLYIMDEPLAGVDRKTEGIIMDLLKQFQREDKTVVAVHHDLNTLQEYFDHVIVLNKVLVSQGTLKTALTKEAIDQAYGMRGHHGLINKL